MCCFPPVISGPSPGGDSLPRKHHDLFAAQWLLSPAEHSHFLGCLRVLLQFRLVFTVGHFHHIFDAIHSGMPVQVAFFQCCSDVPVMSQSQCLCSPTPRSSESSCPTYTFARVAFSQRRLSTPSPTSSPCPPSRSCSRLLRYIPIEKVVLGEGINGSFTLLSHFRHCGVPRHLQAVPQPPAAQ